jgi:hypothetical protein
MLCADVNSTHQRAIHVAAPQLIHLLGLRYRLTLAHARTGGGRTILFGVVWLAAALAGGVFAIGGFGIALAATELGQAQEMAQASLGLVFLCVASGAIMLGVGVEPAFSDQQLRRYPLSSVERAVGRHITALLSPVWLIVLALSLGLAMGFCLQGVGRPWVAVPSALLLALANYLAACLAIGLLQLVLRIRVLKQILGVCVLLVFLAMPAVFLDTPTTAQAVVPLTALLGLTPPGVAAASMTTRGLALALGSCAQLLVWVGALIGGVALVERAQRKESGAADATARWDDAFDRVASTAGRHLAPLIAKQLRYNLRSVQVRWMYPILISCLLGVVWQNARQQSGDPDAWLLACLAAFSSLGLAGGLSLNVFGFDGAGFRRYFLLPLKASRVALAAGIVGVIPGLSLIPIALLLWCLYGPGRTDGRMLVMLLSSGVGGVLIYQSMGLWSSVLGPKNLPITMQFGKRLSPAGSVAMMAGVYWMIFTPVACVHLGRPLLHHWWILPLYAGAGLAFFIITVRAVGRQLVRRREKMMAMIDPNRGRAAAR